MKQVTARLLRSVVALLVPYIPIQKYVQLVRLGLELGMIIIMNMRRHVAESDSRGFSLAIR